MSDYINREDAIETARLHRVNGYPINIADEIAKLPSADVAPVRHGRWATTYRYGFPIWECSECGTQTGTANFPYCFNCGARMDGDDNE